MQGEKMSYPPFDHNFIGSVLNVKASEQVSSNAQADLNLPSGLNIAELLNDEKNIAKNTEKSESDIT
jgi:hypothetical protein